MTLRNLTEQWLCRQPGPGFDLTGRQRRDTETMNPEDFGGQF
jgi:hypothetical protein